MSDIVVFENLRCRPSTRKWWSGGLKDLHSADCFIKKNPVFVMPKKGFLHVHRRIKQGSKTSRPVFQDK